jgi:holo-[acyl-carrier protein] synthase
MRTSERIHKILTLLHGQPYSREGFRWRCFLRKRPPAETITTRFAAMIVGVGHDVFEVARMEAELRTRGADLRDSLFTPAEITYCETKRYPARHFAARFAAKEAFFKALGADPERGHRWRDVEITNEPSGRPCVLLHGPTRDLTRGRDVGAVLVSLSHTNELAAATVVLEARDVRTTAEEG